MTEFEELEERKRGLQLRHDIAKLERSERIRDATSKITSGSWISTTLKKIKYFVRSTFKVATTLFVVVIALSAVGGTIWGVGKLFLNYDAAQYEALREWRLDLQEHLQLDVLARSKLVDGKLFVDVRFNGRPLYLSDPSLRMINSDRTIDLIFQDKDGFPLYKKEIKFHWLSAIVDPNGDRIGLNYVFDEPYSYVEYAKFAKLGVEWSIDTTMPKTEIMPKGEIVPKAEIIPQVEIATTLPKVSIDVQPEKTKETNHCAPNLSREERLERMAQHGEVLQIGQRSYSTGFRYLAFNYDDSLIHCE